MTTTTSRTITSPLGALARTALLVGPLLSMIDSSIINVAVLSIPKDLKVADRASVAPAESHVGPSVSQRAAGRI